MSAADLGTFAVAADPAEVAAFRRTARLAGDDCVPFTYPIRWLALPRVRAAAMTLVSEAGLVPFHESQTFEYVRPLELGVVYSLSVSARRDSAPDRLVIEGGIIAADGAPLARVETVLRLFAQGSAAP